MGSDRVYDVMDDWLEGVPLVNLIEKAIDSEDFTETTETGTVLGWHTSASGIALVSAGWQRAFAIGRTGTIASPGSNKVYPPDVCAHPATHWPAGVNQHTFK